MASRPGDGLSPEGTPNFAAKAKRAQSPGKPMPTDAYWAVAVLVLLVLLAIAVRANVRLERERNEQREHVDFLIKCDGANGATISGLKEALERAQDRNHDLTAQLSEASKNDNRDAKGRYAKA